MNKVTTVNSWTANAMAKADLSFKINQFMKELGAITFKKARARRPTPMVEYSWENSILTKWMVKVSSHGQTETFTGAPSKQIKSTALEL